MRPKISIGFFTIIFFAVLFLSGIYYRNSITVILLLLAFVFHETVHWFFAELFGYKVKEFKLTPLGGCLVIDSLMALHPVAEFVIAIAGPFSNLLMVAGVCYLEVFGIKSPWLENWRQWNWLLGVVNLIPAVPLDGGRVLHAMLKKILAIETAMVIVKGIGLFIGGFILSIGMNKFWTGGAGLLYSLTGIFLLYQVINYQNPKLESFWRMSERRKNIFNKKGYAALIPILVKPSTLVRNVLLRYGGDKFLLFLINKQESTGLITEETAWNLLINKGYNATFQEIKESLPACQNSGK